MDSGGHVATALDAKLRWLRDEKGWTLVIDGIAEDDAAWLQKPMERRFDLEDVEGLCRVLADGVDVVRATLYAGRTYQATISLDPPSDSFSRGVEVWFYPMNESRLVLRVAREPLRKALLELFEHAPESMASEVIARSRAMLRAVSPASAG